MNCLSAAYTRKVIAEIAAKNLIIKKKQRELGKIRKIRILSNKGVLTNGLTAKLFVLQKGLCPCCAQPLGDNYHLDHIMPLALGGSNTDDNIQLLRQRCNRQKHAKHPIDFMQSRGFLL